jgi:hypothetical protein
MLEMTETKIEWSRNLKIIQDKTINNK